MDSSYEEGRSAWPGLAVPRAAFERRLPAASARRADLKPADLYLACACEAGNARALQMLEEKYISSLPGALSRAGIERAAADDALALLRERLLLHGDLASYSGRGSLRAWLRVVAVRIALEKRKRPPRESPSDGLELDALAAEGDPETAAIRTRHRVAFKGAFQAALGELEPFERNLLRLHFLEGLDIEQIGRVHKVHRATVARWIARIRESLLDQTRQKLRNVHRLSVRAADSVLKSFDGDVELSIRKILNKTRG